MFDGNFCEIHRGTCVMKTTTNTLPLSQNAASDKPRAANKIGLRLIKNDELLCNTDSDLKVAKKPSNSSLVKQLSSLADSLDAEVAMILKL
jgi:hypothetical protein